MSEKNEAAPDKCVVVVIDDDPAVRGSLEFSLQTEGFNVQAYASGAELLKQADLPACGCVVVDYFLPGMNGLELALELRKRHMALPIILITTHPSRTLSESAGAVGIEIVEKPLLGNLLSERIRAAIRPCGEPLVNLPGA